jgi:hypothetical protein
VIVLKAAGYSGGFTLGTILLDKGGANSCLLKSGHIAPNVISGLSQKFLQHHRKSVSAHLICGSVFSRPSRWGLVEGDPQMSFFEPRILPNVQPFLRDLPDA